MTKRWLANVLYWYPLVLALLGWEVLANSGLINSLLAPSLTDIGRALVRGFADGNLSYHAELTIVRLMIAFSAGAVLGVILGSAMGLSGRLEEALEPIFSFGYPVPKIALYPIIVFLFGLGTTPKIALAVIECMYPVAMATYHGIKMIDARDVWAARMMGANPRQIYFKLVIPRAAPYIMSALRISVHVALAVIVILEMIGDSTGLGYYIAYAAASFEFGASYAAIVVIVIIGFLIDRSLIFLRRKLVFWSNEQEQKI